MNRLEVTTIEMKIGFINKRSRYDQERIQVVLSNVQDLFGRLADGKNLTNVSVSIDDQGFDDQGAKKTPCIFTQPWKTHGSRPTSDAHRTLSMTEKKRITSTDTIRLNAYVRRVQ